MTLSVEQILVLMLIAFILGLVTGVSMTRPNIIR